MKEKVTGIISFLGALGWSLFGIFIIADDREIDATEFMALFCLFSSSISAILYVVWTKFGSKKNNELEKMDFDNEILKRLIEQNELQKKLNDLNTPKN
jgi:hypothetical protein